MGKKKRIIVYKKVEVDENGSWRSIYARGKLEKHYKINKITKQPHSKLPLATFRTFEDAKQFEIENPSQRIILECEAIESSVRHVNNRCHLVHKGIDNFTMGKILEILTEKEFDYSWPCGTIFCTQITPMRVMVYKNATL